jgi:hypothetical protein
MEAMKFGQGVRVCATCGSSDDVAISMRPHTYGKALCRECAVIEDRIAAYVARGGERARRVLCDAFSKRGP